MRDITIVGASLAGLSTARALRAEGYDGRITLIGDELHRPYDRPPLSKAFLAGTCTEADLALEDADERLDLVELLGRRAVALSPGRVVKLDDGSRVQGDAVVLATGARARSLPWGDGLAGVHVLRTLDDSRALRADLVPGAQLVVIGAGFIGAEVASTARTLGLEVTVLEAAPTPLAGPLGGQLGAVLAGLHERAGVTLRTGVAPIGFDGEQRVSGVRLANGTSLAADVVVVGVGAAPNVEWLADSPLTLANGIACDEHGATDLPGVFAVGDCAAWLDPSSGSARRVEHWTGALERPTLVAQRLLHGHATTSSRPVYFWSDQYGTRIQFAGSIAGHDGVTIEDGDVDRLQFLATYRRGDDVIGVLGVDSVRQFTRWRRRLTPLLQSA